MPIKDRWIECVKLVVGHSLDNAGAVLFEPLGDDRTRVTLKLDADPEGVVETIGANLGFLERRVKGDLERFKEFVESRGVPTGAWRGEIHGEEIIDG